ncbi:MAG: purine-binding chemotaxis protein CheW [Deltaproteobacteria bacterium]|nr:MAG: purine-binding chemotaxis protein CheW [Deltaproteobacteria bacterium]
MKYEKNLSKTEQSASTEPIRSFSGLAGREPNLQPSSPSAEERKRILKARARELAQEREDDKTIDESLEVVEFVLAYEKYGIESSYVREIHPLRELTPVPCTPPFVLGIVNVRGQIISVIDIKRFFDLPERGLTDLNKVIILRNNEMEFGILADVILGVLRVPLRNLQPTLPTLTGIREEYLKGITPGRLAILDAAKLLSDKKLIVHEEVET